MEAPPPVPGAGPAPPHLHPRIVPWRHALGWYEDGMRLFRRSPWTWAGLAVLTVVTQLALQMIPDGGTLLAEIVSPLIACGLVYAAAAADRRESPSILLAFAAFRAPLPAMAAVVAANLFTFGAQAAAAWWIADVNLLAGGAGEAADLSRPAFIGIQVVAIVAALPVTFVPFHVLFERVPAGAAFAASFGAFAQNALPLLVYAAASLVLLAFAFLTFLIGLAVVLPILAASSYAAWKDVFGVRDAPERTATASRDA